MILSSRQLFVDLNVFGLKVSVSAVSSCQSIYIPFSFGISSIQLDSPRLNIQHFIHLLEKPSCLGTFNVRAPPCAECLWIRCRALSTLSRRGKRRYRLTAIHSPWQKRTFYYSFYSFPWKRRKRILLTQKHSSLKNPVSTTKTLRTTTNNLVSTLYPTLLAKDA